MDAKNWVCPCCGYRTHNWVVTGEKCFLRTARKVHQCGQCRKPIERGVMYVQDKSRVAGPWEPGQHYHMECAQVGGLATLQQAVAPELGERPKRRWREEE
jgi:hypothetical protein